MVLATFSISARAQAIVPEAAIKEVFSPAYFLCFRTVTKSITGGA